MGRWNQRLRETRRNWWDYGHKKQWHMVQDSERPKKMETFGKLIHNGSSRSILWPTAKQKTTWTPCRNSARCNSTCALRERRDVGWQQDDERCVVLSHWMLSRCSAEYESKATCEWTTQTYEVRRLRCAVHYMQCCYTDTGPKDRGSKTIWTDELKPLLTQSQPHFSVLFSICLVIESEDSTALMSCSLSFFPCVREEAFRIQMILSQHKPEAFFTQVTLRTVIYQLHTLPIEQGISVWTFFFHGVMTPSLKSVGPDFWLMLVDLQWVCVIVIVIANFRTSRCSTAQSCTVTPTESLIAAIAAMRGKYMRGQRLQSNWTWLILPLLFGCRPSLHSEWAPESKE